MGQVREAIAAGKALAEGITKDLETDKGRAKEILGAIEENAKQIGVTSQAGHFGLLATKYSTGATIWLITAGVFALALIVFLLCFSANPVRKASTVAQSSSVPTNAPISTNISGGTVTPVQHATAASPPDIFAAVEAWLPRLLIISIILTGLIFSLRNYAAQSHNKVVNLHRQTALSSFQTFVTSTADTATKNTVLIQATQAIFAPQPSGYLKSENEVSQLPQVSLITDLVRGGGKPDKS
jgi:hypothetical protein